MRCYYPGPDWTWGWWQWRSIPHFPKLQHYWNIIIRLFSSICRTQFGVLIPLQRCSRYILQPQPTEQKKNLKDMLNKCLKNITTQSTGPQIRLPYPLQMSKSPAKKGCLNYVTELHSTQSFNDDLVFSNVSYWFSNMFSVEHLYCSKNSGNQMLAW